VTHDGCTSSNRLPATPAGQGLPPLPGQPASELEDRPHTSMSQVGPFAVHHRTGTCDHADLVLTTARDRVRGDTRSLSQGLVDPHPVDASVMAVAHDPLGDVRSRDNDDPVDAAGNRL